MRGTKHTCVLSLQSPRVMGKHLLTSIRRFTKEGGNMRKLTLLSVFTIVVVMVFISGGLYPIEAGDGHGKGHHDEECKPCPECPKCPPAVRFNTARLYNVQCQNPATQQCACNDPNDLVLFAVVTCPSTIPNSAIAVSGPGDAGIGSCNLPNGCLNGWFAQCTNGLTTGPNVPPAFISVWCIDRSN